MPNQNYPKFFSPHNHNYNNNIYTKISQYTLYHTIITMMRLGCIYEKSREK